MSKSLILLKLVSAGLVVGMASAHAATGYRVTPEQESKIAPGMTRTDVAQVLGHPEMRLRYGNEPGPTWTYKVAGVPETEQTQFDVDFDANGKVISSEQLFRYLD